MSDEKPTDKLEQITEEEMARSLCEDRPDLEQIVERAAAGDSHYISLLNEILENPQALAMLTNTIED
jgi:hypothetical protein